MQGKRATNTSTSKISVSASTSQSKFLSSATVVSRPELTVALAKDLYGDSGRKSIDIVVLFNTYVDGYLENIARDRKIFEHCGMQCFPF